MLLLSIQTTLCCKHVVASRATTFWKVYTMLIASWRKLIVLSGGIALSLSAGAGVASAEPDMGPILNTTCTYPQVMAALDDQSPDLAEQFNAQPAAKSMLSAFLTSPLPVRQQLAQQARAILGPEYTDTIVATANTCDEY